MQSDELEQRTCAACLIRVALDPADDENAQEAAPGSIGPYRILEQIGEGGMGVVYLAEQTEPIRRRVALKLIKLGMDTSRVIARFESERQTLALMDHPNIAKVHDAGVAEQGRPYFVMEHVAGRPITAYCDGCSMNVRGRIDLWIQVCQAIQHAHLRGIIHRDIKPSNVLVSTVDSVPTVKVIDFGIAKAIHRGMDSNRLVTEHGALVGTPEYMSPEQAALSQDIDARTDVYSLGVLLYELLVGRLPFDLHRHREAGFDEVRRAIAEQEPVRPSARLGALAEEADAIVERRHTDRRALARELRGELDWITMKALEKDRARRYGSVSELVADARRFRDNQPVLAGPPSAAYRARKFLSRHRVGVAAASLVLTLLLVLAGSMAIQARRVARERDRANLEAQAASRVAEFLIDLFEVADPGEARGETIAAREILDVGRERIDRIAEDQPALGARMMLTMGIVYRNLGLHAEAAGLLEQSLATHRRLNGDDHPETLRAMRELGALRIEQGSLEEAAGLLSESHERALRALGDDHPQTVASVAAMGALSYYQANLEQAEAYYRSALAGQRRLLGDNHPDTLETINNLSALLYARGDLDQALIYCREALAGRRAVLGENHPRALDSLINLAALHQLRGELAESEVHSREAVRIARHVLGPRHPRTLAATNNLALLLRIRNKLDEAETYFLDVVSSQREILGDDHIETITSMGNLGDLYTELERFDEAEALLAAATESATRSLPRNHLVTGYTLRKYGRCLARSGRFERAEPLLLEAHGTLRELVAKTHPHMQRAIDDLVELYEKWGKPDEAADWRMLRVQ